ncbi:hypothetical protein SAMD00019534_058750 [Acytostelium subglobosum LB1]|uniref:hypothetical protein n=1 Tax=Acytostelium subglobosum LB1 TaxID=1410327 RepID=UPI00064495C5|nr:hypothetical protein SAMD00019534_058750 [Acytostelium subglobosum LB1]GAM22700.1 hypothetical protein SAMD00019534_058750 [Acytostelium subglobosum LB1]|eukprot:XP_012754820.1 hypothetical protein SAMD00019534_058750 [Acytostelium subglobosum LB1]
MTLTNLTNDLVGKKVLVKVNTETGSDVNGYWYRATVTQVHLRRGKATSASVQLDHEAGLAARCQVWREINGLRQTQSTSSERRSKAIDNKIEALLEKAAHSKTNQMSTYRVGSKQMIVLSDQMKMTKTTMLPTVTWITVTTTKMMMTATMTNSMIYLMMMMTTTMPIR